MDEKQVKRLEEETEKLLDKFSLALSNVKSIEDNNVERDEDRRKELSGGGLACDSSFRKIILENAPQKNDDFIIAEKKTW
ncbi:MAG: hypothetical protein Q8L27_01845 [archaeon]|nr:hypothetical protein [archaeon]